MSAEQDLANANVQIANLISEVTRFRDAAMGLSAIYPTITQGRQTVADGEYFSVPGNGAYMRLYRRQGSTAELIAEFPDRAQVQSLVDTLGGRGVTSGLENFSSPGDLVRLGDAVFAARSNFGAYYSVSSTEGNVDLALPGECALYSTSNGGVFPDNPGSSFFWVETQKTYGGESLRQTAVNYSSNSPSTPRQWVRICANSTNANGERQWGPWAEIFTSQNILGAVSQVAGVPTGGILEYGENANGVYIKLAGGLLINLLEITGSQTSSSGRFAKDYPHRFGSTEGFRVAFGSEDQSSTFTRRYDVNSVSTNSAVKFTAYFGVSSIDYPVRYMIIGRWY